MQEVRILKTMEECEIGDIIRSPFGYTTILLEFLRSEQPQWGNIVKYEYKVFSNFSDNVYNLKFNDILPVTVIGNVGEECVKELLSTKPFVHHEYEEKIRKTKKESQRKK